MTDIEFYGDNALIDTGDVAFTFEVTENPREFDGLRPKRDSLQWEDHHFHIGNYRIYPYGDDNNLPEEIRLVIQNHYMAPGQINKKKEMLWGTGPQLYRQQFVDGELQRVWVDDGEVWDWINSFDGKGYLMKGAEDFQYVKGTFTKFVLARGSRIGRNKIARLEQVSPNKARLASLYRSTDLKATHAIITDWAFNSIRSLTSYKAYRLFDFNNPFKYRNSMYYSNLYSFGADYYTVPDLYGTLEWIRRSSAIPLIFKALSKNSMNIKYHIQSPAEFWKARKESMKKQYADAGKTFKEIYFKEYKTEFLRKVAKTLSGDENTGKFWHSEKVVYVDGHNLLEQGWDIKPIDQNIKDFVTAHIDISNKADRVIGASLGLHGALSANTTNDRSDSGSEQLYAFKNYINSGVQIPEEIVCKPMNFALKANFPNKDLRIGFYHQVTKSETETSPNERIKNAS